MKSLTIKLNNDGGIYRDDKLIGKLDDGEIIFNHHAYRKHTEEVQLLMAGDSQPELEDDEVDETPAAPAALFLEGNGRWWGEESPFVVEWRREHWSRAAWLMKYGHQEELLANNYHAEGMDWPGI